MATAPHERISVAIGAAAARGQPALVPFITAGYPQPDTFIATLRAVACAGDVVEIGVPTPGGR
jgi:tryptophan synthase alpha chain